MIRKYALFRVFECLRNSGEGESILSTAKKAGVGVATAKRVLDYLVRRGLVRREILGRLYLHRLDRENVLTRQLKRAFSVAEVMESGLVEELLTVYPHITSVVLFGSAATGMDTSESDIDVLIISRKTLQIGPLQAEKRIARELSLLSCSYSEWKGKAEKERAFYESVILDGLPLYGELPVVK